MSSRIRVIANSPDYGQFYGARGLNMVEYIFKDREAQLGHLRPADWALWPRWKRVQWMAQALVVTGHRWKVQVFREEKRTRAGHSRYWTEAGKLGLEIPRCRQGVKVPKLKVANAYRDLLPAVIRPFRVVEAGDPIRPQGQELEYQIWDDVPQE